MKEKIIASEEMIKVRIEMIRMLFSIKVPFKKGDEVLKIILSHP